MENLVFTQLSVPEVRAMFREELQSFFKDSQGTSTNDDELLTESQAVKLLSVSKVTLKNWRDTGRIKFHRFGTRIRYKKSDILNPEIKKFGRKAS